MSREAIDPNPWALSALVIKSVSPKPRAGNPTPRVAEVRSGVLNSIGIPGKRLDHHRRHILPAHTRYGAAVVVSVSADTADEFAIACEQLALLEVSVIEANISCPIAKQRACMAFAMSPRTTCRAVSVIRGRTDHSLRVKSAPNAGDIASIAKAAEEAGAIVMAMPRSALPLICARVSRNSTT
jgi:dihydroorotate dehydrogenase (NAD+) catalytic subunit